MLGGSRGAGPGWTLGWLMSVADSQPVHPAVRGVEVHDDLRHQAQRDSLQAEHKQQDTQEEQGPVGDPYPSQPLHQQDAENGRPGQSEESSDATEEPQRLLGEPNQEEEVQHVQEPADIGDQYLNIGWNVLDSISICQKRKGR